METDEEDAMVMRALALAASVLVNFGSGTRAPAIIAEAKQYEDYIMGEL